MKPWQTSLKQSPPIKGRKQKEQRERTQVGAPEVQNQSGSPFGGGGGGGEGALDPPHPPRSQEAYSFKEKETFDTLR
jgi:hypothetical protein